MAVVTVVVIVAIARLHHHVAINWLSKLQPCSYCYRQNHVGMKSAKALTMLP